MSLAEQLNQQSETTAVSSSDGPYWTELSKETADNRVLLLYGPSGSGKTYLAGQLPRPLFLSCDPGTLGGAESAKQFNVRHVKINSYAQLIGLLPRLAKDAGKEFDTLILDSITYMAQLTMQAILQTVNREIPRFEEWNLNATRTRKVIRLLSDLPCHTCFTAIDNISKDETTGKMYGGPSLPGKLATELPQACDSVLRLYTAASRDAKGKLQTKYLFRAVPDDVWFAKDRTGLLPSEGASSFDVLKPLFTQDEVTTTEPTKA